jgi:hypothetical protein
MLFQLGTKTDALTLKKFYFYFIVYEYLISFDKEILFLFYISFI